MWGEGYAELGLAPPARTHTEISQGGFAKLACVVEPTPLLTCSSATLVGAWVLYW